MAGASGNQGSGQQELDLNQASREELMRVEGIGDVGAEDIVKYREEHGGFKSVDELDNVWRFSGEELEKVRGHFHV